MKLLAYLETIAGSMNQILVIVAIALGVIDLAVLAAQSATDHDWRYRETGSRTHATATAAHTIPPHGPSIL
jgi:hypothetical protein